MGFKERSEESPFLGRLTIEVSCWQCKGGEGEDYTEHEESQKRFFNMKKKWREGLDEWLR